MNSERFRHRSLRHHGEDDLKHDLGPAPDHKSAQVLLSDDFRYFGAAGNAAFKSQFPLVGKLAEGLGRGHRVNHGDLLRGQLIKLKDALWGLTQKRKLGQPSDTPDCKICHRGGDDDE